MSEQDTTFCKFKQIPLRQIITTKSLFQISTNVRTQKPLRLISPINV